MVGAAVVKAAPLRKISISTIGTSLFSGQDLVTDLLDSEFFVNQFRHRIELERALLKATLALPHNAGIPGESVAKLRTALDVKERPLPSTASEWKNDDLSR